MGPTVLLGVLVAVLLAGGTLVAAAVLLLVLLGVRRETRLLTARVATLEGEIRRRGAQAAAGEPARTATAAPDAASAAPTRAAPPAGEQPVSAAPAPAPASPAVPVTPAASAAPTPSGSGVPPTAAPSPAPADRPAPELPSPEPAAPPATEMAGAASPAQRTWIDAARAWLFGGNTVVRVGVVILFFGVAFFLGYVAERGWLPIELRLSGAATAGMALLAIGWRLRAARREYALALQGGGAGIVYLTAFAAVNFYDLIGATVGLGVMLVLVVLAAVLAVTQDARSLAVLASLGGFLGPVLVSREGSHVALFSYYAALDAGIVAVAWFRAWRVLNLLGFVFTFIVGAMWGFSFYQPEYFATTQPFLALFFTLFVAVPVLYARRQPPRLTGYVDATLVFGVPLAAYVLQHRLTSDFEYGPAYSALAFAVFYAGVGGALLGRRRPSTQGLGQSFAALAVAFGTLAIPLAFDARWTSAAWALEGAALVWVGARQARRLALLSGLALQLLAGATGFGGPPSDGFPVLNIVYLGGLLVSVSGLFSARVLFRLGDRDPTHRPLSVAALVWGTLWWFGAGAAEISRHLSSFDQHSATLGFVAASLVACGWLRTRLDWKHLAWPPMLLLPAMLIFAVAWLSLASHPLAEWGAFAWPWTFLALYWLFLRIEADWQRAASLWHRGALWLAVFFVAWESEWGIEQLFPADTAWPFVAWALVPAAAAWCLTRFGARLEWPVRRFRDAYLGTGQIPLAAVVGGWVLAAVLNRGNPDPLGYVPLLNPVELVQLLSLGFLFWWSSAGTRSLRRRNLAPAKLPRHRKVAPRPQGRASAIPGDARWGGLGVLAFAALNGVIARATHFLAGVPFEADALASSAVFQTSLSIAWTAAAFAVMFSATRLAWRRAWWAGAALLAAVVCKLFTVDLADIGTVARIVSFVVVGMLILVLGYVSPLPPKQGTEPKR